MMDTTEIIVVISGVIVIAFVLWYFFGEREPPAVSKVMSGNQLPCLLTHRSLLITHHYFK